MSKEMITAIGVAQRLGVSVAEVETLWKEKKLKGTKDLGILDIDKDSLMAYSGFSSRARQTAKCRVCRPPKETEAIPMPVEETKAPQGHFLASSRQKNTRSANEIKAEKEEPALAVLATNKDSFKQEDMREMADLSYKMGRLSVYEAMSEFKKKVRG